MDYLESLEDDSQENEGGGTDGNEHSTNYENTDLVENSVENNYYKKSLTLFVT